ncbi:MAG TPA: hypothetical protein VEZ47_02280 [Gemmatirosa sp.]|nr:hypothetical protein [Gemmatirosa sp.]
MSASGSSTASPRLAAHRLDEAVALLRALGGPHGIHASLAETANYRAVFTRDAVMAGVAGLLLDDPAVTRAFVTTLERLRALQGPVGQIASNFEVRREGEPPLVSYGTVVPRLDAATWYLVGVALGARAGALDPAAFAGSVHAVVRLLDALEYNGRHLLYVPAGGNWADEYVYEGYVLYDQVLRAWGLRLLAGVYGEPAWADKAARIGATIEARFRADAPAPEPPHPVAAFSPLGVRDVYDAAACSLLPLAGVAPALGADALAWTAERFLARGALPPAFHPVIQEGDPDWPALRRYHLYAFRNHPHEYHNGGVWPVWLGWLALALAGAGRDADLARLRALVATRLAEHPRFAFEEYLHGVTGEPRGTPRMAYTATGLVFLHLAGSDAQRRLLAAP